MITVKTPYEYISLPGIAQDAGRYIKPVGNAALVIGSKTALSAVGKAFFDSLEKQAIRYQVKEFQGYPTYAAIDEAAELGREFGADVIVGIGGGKVLDTAKAAGQKTKTPVVAVPTIAATCAAWAALSIIYDEEGSFAGALSLESSPQLVLLDLDVLAQAPVRYLNAGIADTIAKWYESAPNLKKTDDLHLRLGIKTAELALETIETKVPRVKEELQNRIVTKDFSDIIDSIVMLAGLVGSTRSDSFFGGFAHPFYNSITRIPETRRRLHGEKVAFGLLTQAVIEKKSAEEIERIIALLKGLAQPVTLGQLGIVDQVEEKVGIIADGVVGTLDYYIAPDHKLTKAEIERAILRADELGQKSLEEV